jgi:tetratricopeptide (TPR) repeat protein
MSRTDINKVAETILIPLFTEVYGYKELKNLNYTEDSNYPGIDLGDETARVAFQVTSTSDTKKVKHTLSKFVENKFYEKYEQLIIYILTKKQDSYSGSGYEEIIQGKFTFDKDKDIWDYRDILREVANFQIDKARKVESILEANFGEGRRPPEWEVVDKVEQVINESTELFVGRCEEFQKLDEFLRENSSGVILVKAGAGFGKTALLANWVDGSRDKGCFIAYHFFSQRYDVTRSVARAYRNLLRQLYIYYELSYEQPPNDENQLRERLYSILREHGAREDKPLVIVLDGLDEAERPFSPPFPTPLPENVFVIASGRAEEGEEPEYLRGWIDSTESIRLNRLCRGAIADWIRQAGEGELAAFAEDTHFVAQLEEITQGFPLYLGYLTEELIQAQHGGEDVQVVLTLSPKGFGAYVQEQFQWLAQVEEIRRHREVQELFALLSVALGVLSEDDIQELTALNEWDLAALPWQATRWFSIQTGFYSFAHPLLAQEFQRVLGRQASSAKDKLIRYCSCWQEHQRRYALRHYAEHLHEVKRWEELYAIAGKAGKEDFAVAQREHLPDEPDLPLKTVQTALLSAAERDDAGAMAEFMLVHARRQVQTTVQESPLDALRSGSLERALRLANDFYEIERCVLWYLLLAWELKDTGRLEEAQATLKRLQQKELPCLPTRATIHWQGDFAVYLLTHIFEIGKDTCTALHRQLLNDNDCNHFLCNLLIAHADFSTAIETVQDISLESEQVSKLVKIARTQAVKGLREEALNTLAKALEITRNSVLDSFLVRLVVEAQIEVGNRQAARATFTEAVEIADKIANQWQRVSTFVALAHMQAEVGMFAEALNTLQKINGQSGLKDSLKVKVLRTVAEVEAKAGNKGKARVTFTSALKTARSIQDKNKQEDALLEIARVQAELREFTDDALETAQGIGSQWNRGRALLEIVKKRAQAEDFTVALAITSRIEEPESKAQALLVIAKAQAEARKLAAALETAEAIDNQLWQMWQTEALVAIVKAQAEAGDFPAALACKSRIKDQRGQQNALSAIAKAYAKAENFTAALGMAKRMDDPLMQLRTLGSIAQVQLEASQTEAARATFATALQIAQGAEPAFLQALALADVAEVQVKVEQKERGVTTANIAWKIAQEIDNPREQAIAIALIAEVMAKAGKRKEAKAIFDSVIETAQKVKSQQERVSSFTVIAEAQARVDEFPAALQTVQKIEWPDREAEVRAAVAKAQAKAGREQEAHQTISTGFEIAQNHYYIWGSIGALCTVAVAQSTVGQKEEALGLLTELYEAVRESKERDKNLSKVAVAYAKVGEITTALKITDEFEDEWERVRALSWIACAQFEKKERLLTTLAAAREAKYKIEDEEKRTQALRAIAGIEARAREGEQAVRTVDRILTDRNSHLPGVAAVLVEVGDPANFKKLLIPCVYYLDAAYLMCGYLAQLYPEQAEEIAKVVSELRELEW